VEATRGSLGVTAMSHQRLVMALARADVALYAAEACLAEKARSPARAALLSDASHRLAGRALAALDGAGTALGDERTDALVLECVEALGTDLVRPT
jgi:hypothetical protein